MSVRKIAISVPMETLLLIDKIAVQIGENRSRFISTILNRVVKNIQDKEITQQINKAFSTQEIVDEQKKTSDAYLELIDDLEACKW
ncbi:MAG: hypothetical protein ABIF11_08065 [Nitrospirota bacterium]